MVKKTTADVSGCVFSVLLQKVKIRIQNELTVHPSASLSVNEDVRNNFSQSYQCFNALKCRKCAIKKFSMLTPGPLDRFQVSSQVFKSKGSRRNPKATSSLTNFALYLKWPCKAVLLSDRRKCAIKIFFSMLAPGPLDRFQVSSQFFKSKGRRRNHEQKVRHISFFFDRSFSRPPIQQISLFDRTFSNQAFKSTISMLTPGPLVQQISLFDRTFSSLFNSKSRRRNH